MSDGKRLLSAAHARCFIVLHLEKKTKNLDHSYAKDYFFFPAPFCLIAVVLPVPFMHPPFIYIKNALNNSFQIIKTYCFVIAKFIK
jgi:hypothetical protein